MRLTSLSVLTLLPILSCFHGELIREILRILGTNDEVVELAVCAIRASLGMAVDQLESSADAFALKHRMPVRAPGTVRTDGLR